MRCFFCENLDSEYVILNTSEHKHLFKVLRAETGTEVKLMNGKGFIAEAVIEEGDKIKIKCKKNYTEPKKKIHLFVAVPKKNKMDILLAQCTEAGVWAIHPVIADRNVAIPKKENTDEKWNDKLIEACKQSQNPFLPEIFSPIKFDEAVKYVQENKIKAFYGEIVIDKNFKEEIKKKNIFEKEMAWFVGPEGGFSDKEIQIMKLNSFTGISLGNWIMRVETASVTGVSLLQNLY